MTNCPASLILHPSSHIPHRTAGLTIKKRAVFQQPVINLCDPGGIRTHDPQLRRLLLYPAELRGLIYCAKLEKFKLLTRIAATAAILYFEVMRTWLDLRLNNLRLPAGS